MIYILRNTLFSFWLCTILLQGTRANHNLSSPQSFLISEKAKKIANDTLSKAVLLGDINLVKALLKEGVNPNLTDERGWTPLDYAKKRNKPEIEKILLANGARTFPKTLADMTEGPHFRLIDSGIVEVLFLKHNSKIGRSTLLSDKYPISKLPSKIDGIPIGPEDFDFKPEPSIQESIYTNVKKLFVVGDIHGEYDRVFSLLRNNKIIDEDGNWNWGRGHLVFLGDIFDRGSKVTETLWLIFSLEKQAQQYGGKVHLLLGNHEPMIFNNDIRYISDEYYSLCENLGLSYSQLFKDKTVLGHWLRQKPVIIQINSFVLLHAGISPDLYEKKVNLDSVNIIVWNYLNNIEEEKNVDLRQLILGNRGILWYRGLIADGLRKDVIDEITLNRALKFYNASAFIIGHTEVDSISDFFGRKVIDVNIPRANDKIKEQGLLIRGNNLWVAYDSKKRKKI